MPWLSVSRVCPLRAISPRDIHILRYSIKCIEMTFLREKAGLILRCEMQTSPNVLPCRRSGIPAVDMRPGVRAVAVGVPAGASMQLRKRSRGNAARNCMKRPRGYAVICRCLCGSGTDSPEAGEAVQHARMDASMSAWHPLRGTSRPWCAPPGHAIHAIQSMPATGPPRTRPEASAGRPRWSSTTCSAVNC